MPVPDRLFARARRVDRLQRQRDLDQLLAWGHVRPRSRCRSGEIVALEEQRLAGGPGERVGECVADVQSGRMAAAAEAPEGLAGDLGLVGGDRRDLDHASRRNRSRSARPASRLRPSIRRCTRPGSRPRAAGPRRPRSAGRSAARSGSFERIATIAEVSMTITTCPCRRSRRSRPASACRSRAARRSAARSR